LLSRPAGASGGWFCVSFATKRDRPRRAGGLKGLKAYAPQARKADINPLRQLKKFI
jgi:hypothetical protein